MKEFHKESIGKEWEDLIKEFPHFILDISPNVSEWYETYSKTESAYFVDFDKKDLVNLRYGFECNIGWKEIIRLYFKCIEELLDKASKNGDDVCYKPYIFKEKFGELLDQGDFYGADYKKYYEEYRDLNNTLRILSSKICEKCGNTGSLKRKSGGFGWLKTLCDNCSTDLNYH